MIRNRCVGLAVGAMIASLAALPSPAGGEKGSCEVGLFAGFAFLDDYDGGPVTLAPDDAALFGGRVAWFASRAWSLEASYQQLSTETQFPAPAADVDFDVASVRVNGLYNFRAGEAFRPFLTLGAGVEDLDVGGVEVDDESYNAGGGLRWYLGDHFGLRLDGRFVQHRVEGGIDEDQSNIETTVGLLWAFGGASPADTDGDGVRDKRDDCPDTPRGATVDEHGCPKDTDGDGVFDGIDRCPDTPAECKVDAAGCPLDLDGDGVIDCQDKCPDTARGCPVDSSGCPEDKDGDGVCDGSDKCPDTARGCSVDSSGCPKDTDGDGVCDGVDKCSGTAKGCQVDSQGCPKDADGDGVCDSADRCPGTPAGRKVDEKGCEVLFEKGRANLILEGVNFEFDSAKLTAASSTTLDSVAASLREWSDVRVQVEGHTDSVGADAYNLQLSKARAEAVRDYLVAKGVDRSRLAAIGYGESKPLTDNSTDAGRARNRRVELTRLN